MKRCFLPLLVFSMVVAGCKDGSPHAPGDSGTDPVDDGGPGDAQVPDGGDPDGGGVEPAPAFQIDAPTAGLAVVVGSSVELPVTLVREPGFTDFVTLTIDGLPAGVEAAEHSIVLAGANAVATFTLAADLAAQAAGPVEVTVTATSNGAIRTLKRMLTIEAVPDFAVDLDLMYVNVLAGGEFTIGVTVARNAAFTDDITFTAIGLPSDVTLAPLTLTSGESTGSLVFSAAPDSSTSSGTITVRASGGGIDHDFELPFMVSAPLDFAILATPTSVTISRGTTGSVEVTLTGLQSFYGGITVAASGLPTGVTAEAIELTEGEAKVDVVLTVDPSTALGTTQITLTGTHAPTGTVRTVEFDLVVAEVPGFTMSAAQTTVYVPQGGATDVDVTVVRDGGHVAALTLELFGGPEGVSGSSSGIVTSGTEGTITISATLAADLLVPTETLVRASDGAAAQTTSITVVVTPPVDPHIDATFATGGGLRSTLDGGFQCGRVLVSGLAYAGAHVSASRFTNAGAYDASYGTSGRVTSSLPIHMRTCAVSSSGDVVMATDDASIPTSVVRLAKVLGTGAADAGFGTDGVATVDFIGEYDYGGFLVFRPDGSVYVLGQTTVDGNANLVVARVDPTGQLDTSFDDDGMVEFDLGANETPIGVFASGGGVVAVARQISNGIANIAAIRMTGEGVLDATFSGDGVQIVEPPGFGMATAMLELSNGRFLVATSGTDGTQDALGLVRFEADGSLDAGFDGDGFAFVPELADLTVQAMVRSGTGRYFLAGKYAQNVGGPLFGIASVTTAGALDATFSDDGLLTLDDGDILREPDVGALDVDPVTSRIWVFGNLGEDGAVLRFVP